MKAKIVTILFILLFFPAKILPAAAIEKESNTPVIDAIKKSESLEKIKSLVLNGANVEEKDEWSQTASMWANHCKRQDVVDFLQAKIMQKRPSTPLIDAIMRNAPLNEIKSLIQSGRASPEEKNARGETALEHAKYRKRNNVVNFLVEAKARGAKVREDKAREDKALGDEINEIMKHNLNNRNIMVLNTPADDQEAALKTIEETENSQFNSNRHRRK